MIRLDEVIDDRIAEEQDLVETNQTEPVQEPESNVDLLSEELKETNLENVKFNASQKDIIFMVFRVSVMKHQKKVVLQRKFYPIQTWNLFRLEIKWSKPL